MQFPDAIDLSLVGEYSALAKAGGGYFFDEVLEYRVWCRPNPNNGNGSAYYYAFASYTEALACLQSEPRSSQPLVLVRQREWINEPSQGVYLHEKGERVAEWQTAWLADGARCPGAVEAFIKAHTAT